MAANSPISAATSDPTNGAAKSAKGALLLASASAGNSAIIAAEIAM